MINSAKLMRHRLRTALLRHRTKDYQMHVETKMNDIYGQARTNLLLAGPPGLPPPPTPEDPADAPYHIYTD
eukprot:12677645-Heterocapsa_arctica.AAC.1